MSHEQKIKAVGLFSGGLDSEIAARLMRDQGIEVHAVYFLQPWGEAEIARIKQSADEAGAAFHVIELGRDYLDMLLHPEHGYGSAFNPCIDCHRFMVRKAGEFMRQIGAQFVFTGEVVGQRPMSQRKACLPLVEQGTGLEGYLLRPLSAKLLPPTVPEQNNWVDRQKLLNLSGRSRKPQMALADQWGLKAYKPTGGGCLITEKIFGSRLKDFLSWPYRDAKETAVLKWGRYFRLDEKTVAVLGRDDRENELLIGHAHDGDYCLRLVDFPGPLLLLKTVSLREDMLAVAGGIVQYFSKARSLPPQQIEYWPAGEAQQTKTVTARLLSEDEIKRMGR